MKYTTYNIENSNPERTHDLYVMDDFLNEE